MRIYHRGRQSWQDRRELASAWRSKAAELYTSQAQHRDSFYPSRVSLEHISGARGMRFQRVEAFRICKCMETQIADLREAWYPRVPSRFRVCAGP